MKGGKGGGRVMPRGGMNPNDLMRQVQKMQQEMERIQGETAQEVVTVTAGGGMIELAINGGLEVQSIKIAREVVDPDDVEMLQDLIVVAVNEGIQKAQAMMSNRMSALTGGLNIPGL
ncbi:MAG TPA: YbaB/EbfC family nucleoid-associated protein [Anaerolineae bacterium]|nr:YbaB/EbfC family nucleoid-associated protein [Anaerolineae bacterium]HQI86538.1 YbaB/EbfC family nucleoid-associated protein [Anaerolineae bacterium]